LDDNTILLTSVLALVSFILVAARTLTISNPIMDLHAFKDKNFTLGCFFSFSGGVGIFSTVFLISMFFGQVSGVYAVVLGFSVFTTGIFNMISFFFFW
ncbi:MFS transporter, partial [Escherichia coli]